MFRSSLVIVLGLGMSNWACVSTATYEQDLASIRAETRAAQQGTALQISTMQSALEALQRSLVVEAELRAAILRKLENSLAQTRSDGSSTSTPRANLSLNDLESLQIELKKMQEQEQESSTRLRRIEEAIQQISGLKNRTSSSGGDLVDPWSKPRVRLASCASNALNIGAKCLKFCFHMFVAAVQMVDAADLCLLGGDKACDDERCTRAEIGRHNAGA